MKRRTFISSCAGLLLFKISGLSATKEHSVSFAQISDTQFGMANVDAQGKLSGGIRKTIYPLKKIPENHYIKEFQIKKAEKEIENCNVCINAINKLKPDFLFVTGDMVQHRGNEQELNTFRNAISRVDKSIKVYYVPGNHDLLGRSQKSINSYIKEYGYDRFCFLENGIAFVGINTEIINSKKQSLCDSHFEWVANSLNKVKSAKQIFVFGHRPIFTHDINEKNSYSNFNKTERSRYIDLFNKFKVSAYHCGHTHKFDIVESQHCCKQVIVGAVGIPLGIGATSGYYAKNNWIEISKANPDCAKL